MRAVAPGEARLALIGAERFFPRATLGGPRPRIAAWWPRRWSGPGSSTSSGVPTTATATPLSGTVGLPPADSGAGRVAAAVLADVPGRDGGIVRDEPGALLDAVASGRIDAALLLASPGDPEIAEALAGGLLALAELPGWLIPSRAVRLPYLRAVRLPAGTYAGQEAPVESARGPGRPGRGGPRPFPAERRQRPRLGPDHLVSAAVRRGGRGPRPGHRRARGPGPHAPLGLGRRTPPARGPRSRPRRRGRRRSCSTSWPSRSSPGSSSSSARRGHPDAVSEHSRVFLFKRDGTLLAHPDLRGIAAFERPEAGILPTLANTRDPLVVAYRKHLRPEHVRAGEAFHRFAFRRDGTGYLASATTFRIGDELDWIVGAVAPEDDFLHEVRRGRRLSFAVATGALLVAVLLAAVLARRVSGPVQALVGFMNRVGDGDLDARADFAGSREFRRLSAALNRMIVDLRDRLRLRHSLNVAMEVQQRLLPQCPPRVPGLDLAGHSTYCDETGGDYFDFLDLDRWGPDHVLVAVGDVMGHGVASALVMAGVRAVSADRADTIGSLAELMGRLNRMLASDHEGDRFMTMHLAVVDARSGSYRWASAGHDPA